MPVCFGSRWEAKSTSVTDDLSAAENDWHTSPLLDAKAGDRPRSSVGNRALYSYLWHPKSTPKAPPTPPRFSLARPLPPRKTTVIFFTIRPNPLSQPVFARQITHAMSRQGSNNSNDGGNAPNVEARAQHARTASPASTAAGARVAANVDTARADALARTNQHLRGLLDSLVGASGETAKAVEGSAEQSEAAGELGEC